MADPCVREVGCVHSISGVPVAVGVSYDCATIEVTGCTLTLGRDAVEELAQLLISAAWEAGDHAGRLASQL